MPCGWPSLFTRRLGRRTVGKAHSTAPNGTVDCEVCIGLYQASVIVQLSPCGFGNCTSELPAIRFSQPSFPTTGEARALTLLQNPGRCPALPGRQRGLLTVSRSAAPTFTAHYGSVHLWFGRDGALCEWQGFRCSTVGNMVRIDGGANGCVVHDAS